MRILQVSSLFKPHIGGVEKHVDMLSRMLVQDGHEVTVYTSNIPHSKKHEYINGINIFRFNCLASPLNNQITPGIFFKLLNKHYDILHVHSHVHLSSNLAVLSKKFNKNPIVLTSHGVSNFQDKKAIIENIYNRTIAKWMFSNVDRIIALTHSQAEILKLLGANQKSIVVIPNGIDLTRIGISNGVGTCDNNLIISKLSSHVHFKIIKNRKILLYVGSLIPRKGVNYLIESMKYIYPDVVLLIVGGSLKRNYNFENALKSRVRSLGLNNILFLGQVSNEDLGYLYTIADIFILPSLSEGLPCTLIEAMSYKKCVIATKIAGNYDVIHNWQNGVLVNPRDPIDIADKINFILDHDHLKETLGQAARKEIELNYNIEKVYKSTLNVYEDCLK